MTCSATRSAGRALALAAALLAAAACGASTGAPGRSAAELTNPALGPDYSQWLVGAVSRLATPEESRAFMALTDDQAAEQYIRDFWQRRDPSPDRPGNALLEAYEQRAEEADREFSEAGYLGRRTARGEIYIVYGPPTKTDHEVSPREGDPPVELWIYNKTAPAGLDGKRPAQNYRFIRQGDLTVLYIPGLPGTRPHRPTRPPLDRPPF